MTDIIVSTSGSTVEEQKDQITLGQAKGADIIEVRLDYLEKPDYLSMHELLTTGRLPKILTIRHQSEAGPDPRAGWMGKESERKELYFRAMDMNVAYVDIEALHDGDLSFANTGTKKISSAHNFETTPLNIGRDIGLIRRLTNPDYVKFAAWAETEDDANRMLDAMRDNSGFLGMSMGPFAKDTRLKARWANQDMVYACLTEEQATAPGQVSVDEMLKYWDAGLDYPDGRDLE